MRGSSQTACTDRPWHWEYFTCHAVTAIIIPMVQLGASIGTEKEMSAGCEADLPKQWV